MIPAQDEARARLQRALISSFGGTHLYYAQEFEEYGDGTAVACRAVKTKAQSRPAGPFGDRLAAMAATTAKVSNGTSRTEAPPRANGSTAEGLTQQDTRLVRFVRTNIQPIVAGLLSSASRAGEDRDYTTMNEYQTIASQLSQLGGLAAAGSTQPAAPAATMAAAGGH